MQIDKQPPDEGEYGGMGMKKLLVMIVACGIAGCMSEEEAADLDEAVTEADTEEQAVSEPEESNLVEVDPAFASCGTVGPNIDNRRVNDAAFPNAANQRSGSSTSCVTLGVLQPTDDAIYFCYTRTSTLTWTYLQNVRTGKRGWVRDDLLRLNSDGFSRGSLKHCGF
jgi:hypothetical protein